MRLNRIKQCKLHPLSTSWSTMKILHLSTYALNGGAAIAASRLHEGLLRHNVESYMLVCDEPKLKNTLTTNPFYKKNIPGFGKALHLTRYIVATVPLKIFYPKTSSYFSINCVPNRIAPIIKQINPDIIHLHWINDGFLNLKKLQKIGRPIVWSFHDMWGMTGGCHYDNGCTKWRLHCGACPILNSKIKKDLAYLNFKNKQKIYQHISQLSIVGLSKWMHDESKLSPLLLGKRKLYLPNCINLKDIQKTNKEYARKKLKLPKEKQILLFGAMSTKDRRKGYHHLHSSLKLLHKNKDYLLLNVGAHQQQIPAINNMLSFGKVSDQKQMNLLYAAADVTILPSLQENLSNMIIESMSNETPVVAFNIGGNPDMIDHKHNGYLASEEDPKDLATGIEWILNHNQNRSISINARRKIETTFDEKVVIPEYIEMYRSLSNQP